MRMKAIRGMATIGLLLTFSPAHAQQAGEMQTIWRCTDGSNRTHVTNVKEETTGKDCKIIQQQRVNVAPAPPPGQGQAASKAAAKNPSPAGFPKETPVERAGARDRQRQALESELTSEELLLAKAKAELVQQESRGGDDRGAAKVQERLQKYRDNVQLHQKNVEELRKELGKLR